MKQVCFKINDSESFSMWQHYSTLAWANVTIWLEPGIHLSTRHANLHLHTALCLVLSKIASHVQHVCVCSGTHPLSCPDKTTNLCVHTAHTARHARLCLTLMEWQLVARVCNAWGQLRMFAVTWFVVYTGTQRHIRVAWVYRVLRCILSLVLVGCIHIAK